MSSQRVRDSKLIPSLRLVFMPMFVLALILSLSFQGIKAQTRITTPVEQLGHQLGDDYFLANYRQLQEYWAVLADESDRMILETIGESEEGRPQLMAIITSPENHARLDRYREISRSMAKAEYSTDNIGHYGLAFQHYSHFTSPIRRYPDLMVHRLLEHYLEGGSSVSQVVYEDKCVHCSLMERSAIKAERESVKYKQAEYLLDKIGQEFEGLISGVSKWGIYVEIIGNKCEGMVRLQDLQDDFYYLDEDNYQVIGSRHGQQYKLGDQVRIKVKKIDLNRKQMDFEMV